MKNVKVSVLMPVYNTQEEYLRQAIESILNQTFTDFEFIIIDDGSTNSDVKKIIQSYKDKRIKYVYKENSGIADTLNYGMQKFCSGEYIARMDSDDISLPDRFKKQVTFLDTHSDVSVLGAWYERFPEYFVPHLPETVGLVDMLKWCAVAHPLVMLRKKDFEKYHLFYDSSYCCEDYDLWARALMMGLKLANIPEILLKYRYHSNNISKQKQELLEKDSQRVKDRIIRFLSGDLELQEKLNTLFNPPQNNETKNVYFCGIRLLKIKRKGNKTKGYLFGFLPVFKKKEKK